MRNKGHFGRRSTLRYVLVGALVGVLVGACSDSKEPRPPLASGESTGVPSLAGGQGSPPTPGRVDGGTAADAGDTLPIGASSIQAVIGGERVVFAVNARCTVDVNGTLVVQGDTASSPPRGVVLSISSGGDGGLRTAVLTLNVYGSSATTYGSNVGNGSMEVQIRTWPQGSGDRARGTFVGRVVPASQTSAGMDVFDGTFDVARVN